MTIEFEQAFSIFQLLAVILAFYWMHRSFPPQQTAELIQQLTEASRQTPTKIDDILVNMVELLNDLRLQQEQVQPPPVGDPGYLEIDDGSKVIAD